MTITFHTNALSGHAHRVAALLSILGVEFDAHEVDMRGGEHKSLPYLAKNPFGQVPVLEDGEVVLSDSTAILVYLALRYDASGTWLPRDPVGSANVQRWLSVASGELANGLSAARRHHLLGAPLDVEHATATAILLLDRVEKHLATRSFLSADHPTIADLAMYAYVARADEGRVSLEPYTAVCRWLARVEAIPGFVPMARFPARVS